MVHENCSVCCENFNKSTRCKIECLHSNCKFSSCKNCVRTYLLGSALDPHCMNCRKQWDQDFIVKHLNRSFIYGEYKNHRKNLLLDIELSKIPATMEAAEKEKKINVENEKIKELKILKLNLKTIK